MKICTPSTNTGKSNYDLAMTPLDDDNYIRKKLYKKDINIYLEMPVEKGYYT
jgi:hypothetical protein